jgi:hypothetical protein
MTVKVVRAHNRNPAAKGEDSSATMGIQLYRGKMAKRKAKPNPSMVPAWVVRRMSPGLASTPASIQPERRMNGIAIVW